MPEGHGYTWNDLRERPARDLAVGDVFLSWLGSFTAYSTSRDGRVRPSMGCEPPQSAAWTVTARDGDSVTARNGACEIVEDIPERAKVLVVAPPEPVGTVLAVNSHRARQRLEGALGRNPATYYDQAMRRGGKFVVLYGDDVATALGIKSITRTRLKPDDVALCIGNGDEFDRRDADRAADLRTKETGGQ